ncbi:acyl-CoA N-acyltransferase [Hyaloscypha variabilis F]|uniref:Acyl-CoA N-acyltransferase n=1 Tax=Hyaloscypha variabilis (strain UAMH 11265 / GT02V1 / F) TaxID=1149755 RepID=A0A2J6SBL5_HYAVF|nr:acyl-CoA N-acyltransferase [Hyaloscypha variabilis F]
MSMITIRPIKATDLDDIVNIAITAFPFDEQWVYRYPYKKQFPEDHLKFTHLYYAEYLNTTFAGQNTIMVAEAPDLDDPTRLKVIAMSIWDNPGNAPPNPDLPAVAPPSNHPERRDCNPARLIAYSASTMGTRKALFVGKFGQRQLSLRQMATLPDYWRRGAASTLLEWGMERARREGVAVPMFAGNMGKKLYEKFGFKELGIAHVQVEGEEEELFMSAMAWDPKEDELL